MKHNSLSEALLAFQSDLPALVKDKDGQAGNIKTKYADLVQVNREVLSRLNKLDILYTTKPMVLHDGRFVLGYKLEHVPSGEYIEGAYPVSVNENSQRMGSQISYARRYVLLAITGVAAEEEEDDGNMTRTAQRAARPRSQAVGTDQSGGPAKTAQRSPQGANVSGSARSSASSMSWKSRHMNPIRVNTCKHSSPPTKPAKRTEMIRDDSSRDST